MQNGIGGHTHSGLVVGGGLPTPRPKDEAVTPVVIIMVGSIHHFVGPHPIPTGSLV